MFYSFFLSQSGFAVADCGSTLPTVHNGGIMIPTLTTFQSSTTVTCNEGYILNGVSSVTCGANARWSNPGQCICKNYISSNLAMCMGNQASGEILEIFLVVHMHGYKLKSLKSNFGKFHPKLDFPMYTAIKPSMGPSISGELYCLLFTAYCLTPT